MISAISVEEVKEVSWRLDHPGPSFGKDLHFFKSFDGGRLPIDHLIEDDSINIIGEIDIKECFLLVIELESKGWCSIYNSIYYI